MNDKAQRSTKVDKKSQSYVRKLFQKEYLDALERHDIQEEGDVNYIKFGEILQDLHFIYEDGDNEEIVFDAWKTIA